MTSLNFRSKTVGYGENQILAKSVIDFFKNSLPDVCPI